MSATMLRTHAAAAADQAGGDAAGAAEPAEATPIGQMRAVQGRRGPRRAKNAMNHASGPQKRANRPFPAISPVHGPITHAEPCRSYRSPRVSSPAINHRTGRWDPARYVANEASAVRPPETPDRRQLVLLVATTIFVGRDGVIIRYGGTVDYRPTNQAIEAGTYGRQDTGNGSGQGWDERAFSSQVAEWAIAVGDETGASVAHPSRPL